MDPDIYGIFGGISIAEKAEMLRIGNKSGHHFYFKSPTQYPPEIDFPAPLPKKVGYTARIFVSMSDYGYYPPTWEGKNIDDIRYREGPGVGHRMAEVKIRNSRGFCLSSFVQDTFGYKSEAFGHDTKHKVLKDSPTNDVENEGFTTLAVRIETATALKAYYLNQGSFEENVGDIMNSDLRICIRARWFRIHSLHVTVETDDKNEPWGSSSLLWDRELPMQTAIMYTVRPKKDRPSNLYIELPGSGETKVNFTNKVKKGQSLVFMVRLKTTCLVVTNNFDENKHFTVLKRVNEPFIKAKFHDDLEIMKVEGMSPPGSHEAAAASGNRACSEADQLDDTGSYELLIEEFVRDLRDQSKSTKEEALPDGSKKQETAGAKSGVDAEKVEEEEEEEVEAEEEKEEQLPHRHRRQRRSTFKRLGSVGGTFSRAKVVKEKDPFQCYRCQAKFKFKRGLEYHLKTHSGAPLLPCDFCPLEFPTGRMLSNHCSRKHGRPLLSGLRETRH
ncbi:uncharacterized protein LOC144107963 [Amblyomma americanum]